MKRLLPALAATGAMLVAAGCCGRRATEPPASPPPPGAVLPRSAFSVGWEVLKVPASFQARRSDSVLVRVRNESDSTWPDRAMADPAASGVRAVRLAHRWTALGATAPPPFGTSRMDLPAPLAPGESVDMLVPVEVPAVPGHYTLELALVQENVAWFADNGGATLAIAVRVN